MPVSEPILNEFERALLRPATISPLPPNHRLTLQPLPEYHLTPLTEWAACLYAKEGIIKAKTHSGLVTYWDNLEPLDWAWLQRQQADWVCCPQCGRAFPKEARYWWVRNKAKGYLWLDACRDCKCSTDQRWGERKRNRLDKPSHSVQ